jgi:hypothetical protein
MKNQTGLCDQCNEILKRDGQPASIKIAGRWFCGRHAEALAS